MSSNDWEKMFFTHEEIEDIKERTNEIIYNNENGIIINIAMSNEQCMEFCYHYDLSRRIDGDVHSAIWIEGFISFFNDYLLEHLYNEGLDYRFDFRDE